LGYITLRHYDCNDIVDKSNNSAGFLNGGLEESVLLAL